MGEGRCRVKGRESEATLILEMKTVKKILFFGER